MTSPVTTDSSAQRVVRLRRWTYAVALAGALVYVIVFARYIGSWTAEPFESPPLVIVLLMLVPYAAAALAARVLPRTPWQGGILLVGVTLVTGYGIFVEIDSLERPDLLIGLVVAGLSFLQLYAIAALAGLIVVMRGVSWLRQRTTAR